MRPIDSSLPKNATRSSRIRSPCVTVKLKPMSRKPNVKIVCILSSAIGWSADDALHLVNDYYITTPGCRQPLALVSVLGGDGPTASDSASERHSCHLSHSYYSW